MVTYANRHPVLLCGKEEHWSHSYNWLVQPQIRTLNWSNLRVTNTHSFLEIKRRSIPFLNLWPSTKFLDIILRTDRTSRRRKPPATETFKGSVAWFFPIGPVYHTMQPGSTHTQLVTKQERSQVRLTSGQIVSLRTVFWLHDHFIALNQQSLCLSYISSLWRLRFPKPRSCMLSLSRLH